MHEQNDEEAESLSDPTTIRVRHAIDGDLDSLSWVIERLSPLLLSQARYRISKHLQGLYEAEDLVQDVWITVIGRLDDLRSRDHRMTPVLLRFMSQVLLNRYRNLLHKHIQGKPLKLSLDSGDDSNSDAPRACLSLEQTGAVSRAMQSELSERVLRSLESLSEQDREVVILRGIEQNGNQEAALILHVDAGTVAVRYHRALQKLRKAMPESVFDELALDAT